MFLNVVLILALVSRLPDNEPKPVPDPTKDKTPLPQRLPVIPPSRLADWQKARLDESS